MIKIPPPVIGLLFAIAMWALSTYQPIARFSFTQQHLVALALVLAGLAIDFSALWSFRKAKTTINPLKPENSSSVVTNGIYRYSRNPMYLGMLIILCGVAVYLGSVSALLVLPLFVVVITINQIVPEEKVLQRLFGQTYTDYKNSVRRWC